MADQNTTQTDPKFFSEVLSPTELFAARSRSHKIPVRGQKDFFPDESEEQRQRLEQSLSEHWSLISEERVERLGSLVKGVWIPHEQIVELQTPAGKFWQTMGFSADGKQYLLPEEALFLMECGNVQVFYQDLPLSIQDAYESFLSSNTISFQQYLVFGHLKRLGYVVHRFDPSSQPSAYTRQLNLPVSRDRATRPLKRKRSPSPTTSSSQAKTQSKSTEEKMEQESGSCEGAQSHLWTSAPTLNQTKEDESSLERMEEDSGTNPPVVHSETVPHSAEGKEREPGSWWSPDGVCSSVKPTESCLRSGSSRWDSSCISFPDVGSASGPGSDDRVSLAAPDPTLLPGALTVGPCDVAPWRQRINQKEVRLSPKERKREEEMSSSRLDVNKDTEVQRCRNWAEYRELMERRQTRRRGRPSHLWEREVTPLHDPTQPLPHEELLDKISVIKSTTLLEGASRLKPSDDWRISFNVYQPNAATAFKKSSPGKPYVRMVVCRFDGPVPDLRALQQLATRSPDAPVVFAAIDHGDISFYTFKDFQLPRDVFP